MELSIYKTKKIKSSSVRLTHLDKIKINRDHMLFFLTGMRLDLRLSKYSSDVRSHVQEKFYENLDRIQISDIIHVPLRFSSMQRHCKFDTS